MMDILALDLGTHTGFAYNHGEEFLCGTWTLATPKEVKQWGVERANRTEDPRVKRLCHHISDLGFFDLVVFEDVQFSIFTLQTQLWSALRSSIWLCANAGKIDCVSVGTLKKFATGNGAALKEVMKIYAGRRADFPFKVLGLDDNAIDAGWAWVWAKHTFARMKKL